jgi:hypothetical protein
MIKLTPPMCKALLQIGYGVTGRAGGFFDEDNERVDLRSAQALLDRNLVFYGTKGGAPMSGALDLTPCGWLRFYEITGEKQ